MSFTTADLYDEHGDDLASCDRSSASSAQHRAFKGRATTVRCFEDNALLKSVRSSSPGTVRSWWSRAADRCIGRSMGDNIAKIAVDNGWAGSSSTAPCATSRSCRHPDRHQGARFEPAQEHQDGGRRPGRPGDLRRHHVRPGRPVVCRRRRRHRPAGEARAAEPRRSAHDRGGEAPRGRRAAEVAGADAAATAARTVASTRRGVRRAGRPVGWRASRAASPRTRIIAIGLARPRPAMSGAEPCEAWAMARVVGAVQRRRDAQRPGELAGQVGQDVAEHVLGDEDVEVARPTHQVHRHRVDVEVVDSTSG